MLKSILQALPRHGRAIGIAGAILLSILVGVGVVLSDKDIDAAMAVLWAGACLFGGVAIGFLFWHP